MARQIDESEGLVEGVALRTPRAVLGARACQCALEAMC
jgi:hypothetical protein